MALAAAMLAPMSADAATPGLQPGQWEYSITIRSIDTPNAMIARMMAGRTTTARQCVTPEQAARGPEGMLKLHSGCQIAHQAMSGSTFSWEMACKKGGGAMTTASSGVFTPTSFSATGRTVMTGRVPATATSSSSGRRIGDCR